MMADGNSLEMQAKADRYRQAVGKVVDGGLESALARAGAVLTGVSIKMREYETLLVLKGVLAGRPQVSFVASSDLGHALLKAVREANADKLVWRDDKWAS